jgi:tRNA A-37 threonylcarbamoyl transferase component Bud32
MTTNYDNHYKKIKLIRQLGLEGRDAITFETDKGRAFKSFKATKPLTAISREYYFLKQSEKLGISPKVLYYNPKFKYFLMEKMDKTLPEYITQKKGILSIRVQKDIINIFKKLDNIGIYHNDPNIYNFMFKDNKLYIIDFGMSIESFDNNNIKYMPDCLIIYLRNKFPNIKLEFLEKYSQLFT